MPTLGKVVLPILVTQVARRMLKINITPSILDRIFELFGIDDNILTQHLVREAEKKYVFLICNTTIWPFCFLGKYRVLWCLAAERG